MGYKLAENADEIIELVNSEKGNKKAGQCPCKFLDGTRCLCKEHKEEIEKYGQCHCGLFLK
jgi:ferredoxin-thioredoxin reductase catalytic subunit